jgi:2'-5' RNA ligase
MKNRIFIAINLPVEIKKQLVIEQQEIDRLFTEINPIRWTKQDNLHITLLFIGQISKEELANIVEIVNQIQSKYSSFSLELDEIIYGPRGNYDFDSKIVPRMIWVNIKQSKELFSLQKELQQKIKTQNNEHKDKFSAHITLGRINQWQWKTIEPNQRPIIKKEIAVKWLNSSIEIMNSQIDTTGPEYTIYKSFNL